MNAHAVVPAFIGAFASSATDGKEPLDYGARSCVNSRGVLLESFFANELAWLTDDG